MTTEKLTIEETAVTGFTHKWVISYTDLVAAGATTSTAIDLYDGSAGEFVGPFGYYLPTSFTGGSTSDLTLQIGYSGTVGAFLPSISIHASGANVLCAQGNPGTISALTVDQTYGTEESTVIASLRSVGNNLLTERTLALTASKTINATFTSSSDNLSALTAGVVNIFGRLRNMTKH